jgi:serine/threonine protein phosphatase PrpC
MAKQLKVSVGQYSDKGRKAENQDFHGIYTPHNSQLMLKGIAMAVADGISSSPVSQVASQVAVKNFLEDYYCTTESWSVRNSAERVLVAINSWLHTQTRRSPYRYEKDKGYVCTFSGIVIKNKSAHIFHIGDSRVYRLNDQGMEQLTHDHRLWVTQDQSHLSRALGMDEQCSVDYQTLSIKINDIFITMTDGIYEFVDSTDIKRIITEYGNNLTAAAEKIAGLAFANNSPDNLTVQILKVDELPESNTQEIKQKIDNLPLPPALAARMGFDGYVILRELHCNNRSHIYLAEDTRSHEKVVIKVLATERVQNESALERFLLEEWVARRIQSNHVLKAYLPDIKRNYFYTVFEFIEGQTLAQWARDNPQPSLETVRGIVEQIAKGLHAFHRMEMLHQDLRPENIMIDRSGTVKIIDFGAVSIAGLEEADTRAPLTYLNGTALYSAPEYFLGEQGSVQSDLFSLGIITYFLLSGSYPYGAKVARIKTSADQRRLHYSSLRNEKQAIPAWVDSAVRKMVHPVADRRYEDAFEFIHDLRHPNSAFLQKNRQPLMETNPVAVWQGISILLFLIVLFLLSRG